MTNKDGKKIFIFRHLNHFYKFRCKTLEEAKFLMFAKRLRDSYYYIFVAEVNTHREAKEYIKNNSGKPYINAENMHKAKK